ncbi:MAG: hypothetical protein FJX47_13090 [Alphaproteobacteria bacterium]|nr:hypothetical protein [Alphaproteobacteria bacterium]
MTEKPSAADLAAAIGVWLKESGGRDPYLAKVAVNVLGIIEREARLAPAADAEEGARLAALLGTEGDLDRQRRELCRRIRAGDFDQGAARDVLARHLRATATARIAIDNPKWALTPPS